MGQSVNTVMQVRPGFIHVLLQHTLQTINSLISGETLIAISFLMNQLGEILLIAIVPLQTSQPMIHMIFLWCHSILYNKLHSVLPIIPSLSKFFFPCNIKNINCYLCIAQAAMNTSVHSDNQFQVMIVILLLHQLVHQSCLTTFLDSLSPNMIFQVHSVQK